MADLKAMMSSMNEEMKDSAVFEDKKQKGERDKRLFRIGKDADGNGSAKVRFLPSFDADKTKLQSFITKKNHNINVYSPVANAEGKKQKRWFEGICPKQHGEDCPICDYGWEQYKYFKQELGDEKKAKEFLKFVPDERFMTNIYVIEDKNNPDNEGKVFLFEYGGEIRNIMKEECQPSEEQIEEKNMVPFNAWDIANGRDFRLKFTDKKHNPKNRHTWDSSFFSSESSEFCTVGEFEDYLEQTYCLDHEVSKDKIKSFDELEEELNKLLFKDGKKGSSTPKTSEEKESKNKTLQQEEKLDLKKDDEPPFDMEKSEAESKAKDVEVEEKSEAEKEMDDFLKEFDMDN